MKSCFPFACCAVFVTILAAQTSTVQSTTKESKNCTVEGQVVQEPGAQPLRKVTVTMFSEDEEDKSYTEVTDVDGHFKIEHIPPGRYNVHIERNGFLAGGKHPRRYFFRPLTLEPGQNVKELLFQMQPAAVISGKILDADGDPIRAFVRVSSYQPNSSRRNNAGWVRTNDLG